ncbi:hypothetical protein Q5H92_15510 [Hymenobacter sp. M29]|uniref:Uncharacterized protein n=1 Tax=Hymenobacter mellowenesis TaxID=3063995 RepID=A0ABT9AEH0_9BACT|nr:hypothetical protein [Hymenobacter sp. M29]MDO7847774.1 hypothetical protein [Hymenobacter sp. M29]
MKALTIYLFQTFKERVSTPFEVTVWLLAAGVSSFRFPLLAIGSAKVRRSFEVASERRKFYSFFVSLFKLLPPPVEAGCKGKALFSAFTRAFEI